MRDDLEMLLADPVYQQLLARVTKVLDDHRDKLVTMSRRAPLDDIRYEGGFYDGVRSTLSILRGEV